MADRKSRPSDLWWAYSGAAAILGAMLVGFAATRGGPLGQIWEQLTGQDNIVGVLAAVVTAAVAAYALSAALGGRLFRARTGYVVSIGLTACATLLALDANRVAGEALADQRVSSAWEILAIPGSGSTGKRYAIEAIADHDNDLSDLDLSCREAKAGGKSTFCYPKPNLDRTRIGGNGRVTTVYNTDFGGVSLRASIFSNVEFSFAGFTSADLEHVAFAGSSLKMVSFDGARLRAATFEGTVFDGVDLTGADVTLADFTGIRGAPARTGPLVTGTNISGTVFCSRRSPFDDDRGVLECAKGLTQSFFDGAFYYAARPPVGLALLDDEFQVWTGCPEFTGYRSPGFMPPQCPREKASTRTIVEADRSPTGE